MPKFKLLVVNHEDNEVDNCGNTEGIDSNSKELTCNSNDGSTKVYDPNTADFVMAGESTTAPSIDSLRRQVETQIGTALKINNLELVKFIEKDHIFVLNEDGGISKDITQAKWICQYSRKTPYPCGAVEVKSSEEITEEWYAARKKGYQLSEKEAKQKEITDARYQAIIVTGVTAFTEQLLSNMGYPATARTLKLCKIAASFFFDNYLIESMVASTAGDFAEEYTTYYTGSEYMGMYTASAVRAVIKTAFRANNPIDVITKQITDQVGDHFSDIIANECAIRIGQALANLIVSPPQPRIANGAVNEELYLHAQAKIPCTIL